MKPVWIFDLDNTLHNADLHAFPVINRAMTAYLAQHLSLSPELASILRTDYWRRYGATLLGLRRHHPHIDPLHFLRATHPLSELLTAIHPMPGLKMAIRRLPGEKILFTNGARHYAKAMMLALGIDDCFNAVVAVEDVDFIPKPHIHGYRRLISKFKLKANRCIFVEDTLANLVTAKRLGMKTVWLNHGSFGAQAADLSITSLRDLPQRSRYLLASSAFSS
ncbi:pyrimidine 5'-nucleotidase [Iodobacter fluviatilis]|uniref:Pyrimidine 5'-nucleotidase n=1 Tax=Iodobacter fluviatilis TaxID=537 RepID=A0A7G3G751_9NEIS|nr:pyrimidine 5'-nucleotidase [Iodobacter fluviatilis]QBC43056.1 pyrimidine 5'-nucleotidase [Iodobacter fluviatilis]